MHRFLRLRIDECGGDCPMFEEDAYDIAVHGCKRHSEEMPSEMFWELPRQGKGFPDVCPLSEEDLVERANESLVAITDTLKEMEKITARRCAEIAEEVGRIKDGTARTKAMEIIAAIRREFSV